MSKEIEVKVSEVVDYLKLGGAFNTALEDVVQRKIAVAEAKKRGIEVTDEELQHSADLFRQLNNIRTADAASAWLDERGLTLDALETYLEENLLIFELKNRLVSAYDKASYFSTLERQEALRAAAYSEFIAKAGVEN